MNRGYILAAFTLGAAVVPGGCAGTSFGKDADVIRFEVTLADGTDAGSRDQRKDIAVNAPDSYTISVRAVDLAGKQMPFNGWLRIGVKPGSVVEVDSPDAEGRNVYLQGGEIRDVQVKIARSYGDTRIVVEDLGYEPVDPTDDPPPACSNGIDDDGDGLIDFPADPGCAFANDDSEGGGSYSAGVSGPIFYKLPRIADLKGAAEGGAGTPFKSQTVQIDTGYREDTRSYVFDTVVTRLASNGFYVTDIENDRPADQRIRFGSAFAFNFNTPPNMRPCDHLRRFSGTATEFYGSIQLGFPTWSVEPWDGKPETCKIPEPYWMSTGNVTDTALKLSYMHSLVRVRAGEYMAGETRHVTEIRVGRRMGPGSGLAADGSIALGDDATNCDLNGDGSIDYNDGREGGCANACDADVECTEWSNFVARANFQLVVKDTTIENGNESVDEAKIQANGSTSPTFDPRALRGQALGSFTGTLGYFSGGSQFTIEARCTDDIVVDPSAQPMAMNQACIPYRTDGNTEEQQ